MTDRSDFAIATCANADSLDRRRPVRRVVHQEGAGQGDLHGAPGFAGGERGKHRICSQEQLDSETTAHEGRHDMDFLLVDSERRREIGPPPVDHLARRPDSQVIAIPGGDGGVRLHHRMRLIRGRIDLVELNGRCLEAGIEVARSGGTPSFRLDGAVLCRRQVECALFLGIIDLDQRGGRASLLECFRDHDGDRLVIVLNLHAAEELGRVVFSFLQFPHRFCRYDRDHARGLLRGGGIHGPDPALGDCRADHIAIGIAGIPIVPLIGIDGFAGGLERTVDAVDGLADDLALVDRVRRGWCVESHRLIPSLRKERRSKRVRQA